MQKIGIVGGLGPESTLDYYKEIIVALNTRFSGKAYPEIIIYSANINELMSFVEAKNWAGLSGWLLDKICSLHRAGAEFAAIASNTPHIVFADIQAKSPIPLISIVEETCNEAIKKGLTKIGLIGTKLTMEAEFYKTPFTSKGISIVVPSGDDQQYIHNKLFSEIELGIIKESTRSEILTIVEKMVIEGKIDGLVLGCTELPLILTKSEFGIPFLNTTAIHCLSIVEYCIRK